MRHILPTIVIAQFMCTSLWFTGNAIMVDIAKVIEVSPYFLAHLTSAIQFGFIAGTLVFAIFTIADRFSPSKVFFICAVLGGICNLGISLGQLQEGQLLIFRFLTGFFLAGIYPVGMKIASDYYKAGLGRSLGYLVGALVVGTALPHLLKSLSLAMPWQFVIYATTALSFLGGTCLIALVPDGPYRKVSAKLHLTSFVHGFRYPRFRAAALGYFGHMWELYTFWTFLPVMLAMYNDRFPAANLNISLWSFVIIASGGLACVISGTISQRYGGKKMATICLMLSGLCCLLSPLCLLSAPAAIFIAFLSFWGLVVVADSPLFSALVAQNVPDNTRGTSLTIVNCIGYSVTILSLLGVQLLADSIAGPYFLMVLALGPILGLLALLKPSMTPAKGISIVKG